MSRPKKPGLFVMEGDWSARLTDVRSVRPVLQALADADVVAHVRLQLNDREDLVSALKRWGQKQHDVYGIGYLALHGSPGQVHVGRTGIDLTELAEELSPGRLATKILHFGSCSVLDLPLGGQQRLRKALGVRALSGFTKDVSWFESMAFELLLFEALAYYSRPSDAYNYLTKHFGELSDKLGFVLVR